MISIFLCSCVKSQGEVDNIIPDYARRTYSVADLIPYTYKELKNAQAYYAKDLINYYDTNTSTDANAKRITKRENVDFYYDFAYRNHNYRIIKKRFEMFAGDEMTSEEQMKKEREKEYDKYYKVGNAEGIETIKKYNNGKAFGVPLISIKVLMNTATISEMETVEDTLVSSAMCEIYKPVVISCEEYDKLNIGDIVELDIPEKVACTYIATDSLMYKNDKGEDLYYFIGCVDGTNDVRRICDKDGKTIEYYVETKPLGFMKYCRVTSAKEPLRLIKDLSLNRLKEYYYNDLAERAFCGGYLIEKYKDYIYANQITTDRKGYITSLIDYDNLCTYNEFLKDLNK